MPRKLLIAAALLLAAFLMPPAGTAQAHVHPWGGHGHFVGHVHHRFVGHRFAFRHGVFRGHRFVGVGRFGGRFGGWRGGWWWHGGWGWRWWWPHRWWWGAAWWWHPYLRPYPAAYAAPAHVAYHPVHPVAAPPCTCTCCK